MIIAVVGAGGKTSLIKKLAREAKQHGEKVFVTTSTHMMIESNTLLTDEADDLIKELEEKHYVMAGQKYGEKIQSLSPDTYYKVCAHADVVLIEADGSKHMPIKFPQEGEPVIYDNVEEIIVVCGLHALGKKACEAAHRLELVKQCLKIEDDTMILPEHIQKLVQRGYIEPLKEQYPEKTITIQAMHDHSLYQRAIARMIEEGFNVSLLREEWFHTQPELIICGAGHVAADLVKLASCLDFRIRVIDDREEFADRKKHPLADEVIFDSFQNLENHLGKNAYYVVLTRGHKSDFDCVKTILNHSYQYLGMIGSKLKVKATLDKLRDDGFSEEQLQTIHAPIGLAIRAKTPAEIAVSILAEMILEKNQNTASFASRNLLNVTEKGTLCVIIEKKGSAPRGVGSMMFVNEHRIVDTVGGGAVESAVIADARETDKVRIKEYNLSNTESAALGMICGGSNKILFIPV